MAFQVANISPDFSWARLSDFLCLRGNKRLVRRWVQALQLLRLWWVTHSDHWVELRGCFLQQWVMTTTLIRLDSGYAILEPSKPNILGSVTIMSKPGKLI